MCVKVVAPARLETCKGNTRPNGLKDGVTKWRKKIVNIKEKKINAFGRSISAIAVVLMLLTTGIAGAALVSVYFTTAGTVNVSAPLSVSPTTYEVPLVAGNTHEVTLEVTNSADVAIPANLVTVASDDISVTYLDANRVPIVHPVAIMPGTTTIYAHIELRPDLTGDDYVITTTAVPVANRKALILENKDPADAWNIIDDNRVATLIYNPRGNNFNYALIGSGLEPNTEYSLIYYADKAERFTYWGGDNPGALIGIGTTTTNGNLAMDGSINLNMNLPCPPDANIDGVDYTIEDGYSNAHGAKLWLVPSSDYNEGEKRVTVYNPTDYLFETDLISYTDTNIN